MKSVTYQLYDGETKEELAIVAVTSIGDVKQDDFLIMLTRNDGSVISTIATTERVEIRQIGEAT